MITDRTIILRIVETDELPDSIGGVSDLCGNESYIVLLNSNHDEEKQKHTFIHEMLHIWHKDHYQKDTDIRALEAMRHEETDNETEVQSYV